MVGHGSLGAVAICSLNIGPAGRGLGRGAPRVALAVAAVVVSAALAAGAVVLRRGEHPTDAAVRAVRTSLRVVALSFDDGPDPRWTPAMLAVLARYGAHATFFVVGRHVIEYPELVREELAAGDELGNHTFTHIRLDRLSRDMARSEVQEGASAIKVVGGRVPALFRPPLGKTTGTVARIVGAEHERLILWSAAVEHYVDHHSTRVAVRALLARVHPGSIILAHDGGPPDRGRTLTALPAILAGLRARGYRVVTVSTLLGLTRS